jgi:hypothetical protein
MRSSETRLWAIVAILTISPGPVGTAAGADGPAFRVREDAERIVLAGPMLEAAIRKQGYVSGVESRSFLDVRSGFRDPGFGLDIVDWLMENGADDAYRDRLPGDLPYLYNNLTHGRRPKRSIEGPQVCTQAKQLTPVVVTGRDFVAVRQGHTYTLAAPGKKAGSRWEQSLVFPAGKRYFLAADKVTSANESEGLFLRIDMPGHIRHHAGDTFSEVYLSYRGIIPSREFLQDFPPDEKFLYVREEGKVPSRIIRGYHLRDPKTGKDGPWLAALTLDPSVVSEAWCHQRGYVCMIQEIGGRPVKPEESFGAASIIGYFDSIDEMNRVYDEHAGRRGLRVGESGWTLTRDP